MRHNVIDGILEIFYHKNYELLQEFSPKAGWNVIDIGSASGDFAVYTARKGAQVIAFEPERKNFEMAKKNAEVFGFTIIHKAVADWTGKTQLQIRGPLSHTLIPQEGGRGFEDVDVVTLDDSITWDHIDLLKIDAEATELMILKGGVKTIRRTHYIVMEPHHRSKELVTWLLNNGFAAKVICDKIGNEYICVI